MSGSFLVRGQSVCAIGAKLPGREGCRIANVCEYVGFGAELREGFDEPFTSAHGDQPIVSNRGQDPSRGEALLAFDGSSHYLSCPHIGVTADYGPLSNLLRHDRRALVS